MRQEPTLPDAFDAERSALAERVKDAIGAGIVSDEAFNALALAVYRHQLRWNRPYAQFAQAQGGADAANWSEIPAVSTEVFKFEQLPLVCGEPERASHRFRTSGTTGEARGSHYFHSLDVYEASIANAWRELELPVLPPFAVTLSPDAWPESSLGHMVRVLADRLPAGGGCFIESDGTLQVEALDRSLRELPSECPVLVLGTALAFLRWFESMETEFRQPIVLPVGSAALETGGYKGSGIELEKSHLYQKFESYLGVPADRIINEYSMTELSSQFYTQGIGRPHRGPSWTRVRILHPETRREVPVGECGYVEIFDLANIDSVLAIQTRDIAIRHEGGEFELQGRDPAALPRGCSRAADELLAGSHSSTAVGSVE
ncbi:MAG: hypothetical protein ACI9R3_003094 [Verrucomicrobiales bacterium]